MFHNFSVELDIMRKERQKIGICRALENGAKFGRKSKLNDKTISLITDMREQGKQIMPEIQDALDDYFDEYEVLAVEMPLMEPIEGEEGYKFKGFIDAIIATPDGKVHIFDWKTCSWGWDARRKSDKLTTYQLTLYKHFFAKATKIPPEDMS